MHSVADGLDLDVENLEISCIGGSATNFADATSLTYPTQTGFLSSQTGTNGGAFSVSATAQIPVVSNNNKIHGCYTAAKGGAWSLDNVDFTDQNSEYSYTAAVQGGVFYAKNSEMDVSDALFTTHEAFQGGVAYLEHPGDTSFTNIEGYDDGGTQVFKAYQFSDDGNGGVFYIVDDSPATAYGTTPTLTLTNWEIQYASAEGNGGFAYIDLPDLDVDMDVMVFEDLQAGFSGGGFYAENWDDIQMNDIEVQLTEAPLEGSFFYSVSAGSNVDIIDSIFSCFGAAYNFLLNLNGKVNAALPEGDYGGLFYIEDA